ncbi:AzlD domain-containing protein [Streptomyces sp. WAC 00631]|uniref:AzlD domain-containing protein n=1 Tax=unclassified Streptomyces TaxID=2593676 RepID=UPI000F794460|nr:MULTISPECIES: AzlD domain-containing protein [unclassified Streptomyces]MCC5033934.1 AzlD domain-containing protein [Streptomyces sp. WAC 00631]MCC9742679.1 AzlD domain-containing protein [Streptomyces sp. MNU89]
MSWTWIAVAAAACFALKLLGLLVPQRTLDHPAVSLTAEAVPVALLAALIAVQTFTAEQQIALDARVAGIAVAALCIWKKAPFLVTVVAAAAVTALLRWAGAAG